MKKFFVVLFLICTACPVWAETIRWNATEMGVVADGKTDCTAALQAVLNQAAEAGGGIVELSAGRFRFDGTLEVPRGVTLQGTYRTPPTIHHKDQKPDGTVLLVYAGRNQPNGTPFLRLAGCNAAVAGVIFVYPEWDIKTVPPVPYPPCIESHDTDNVAVLECCLLNPYEGIRLVRAARHLVRNVTGYPSFRGLYVDQCYDIGHIENIHFWPFGLAYRADHPYCEWINKNGIAFEFARTDWHYVSNTFCFGYGVGYKFSEAKHGGTNGNFLGIGADSCRRAVRVEQSQNQGLLITNGEFVGRWTSTDSICLEICKTNRGKVSLTNCSFWGPVDICVTMNAPNAQCTLNACHFESWDNGNIGSPCIRATAGKMMVQGCTFEQVDRNAVEIQPAVCSAILTGNQASGGFRVLGKELRQVEMAANERSFAEQMTLEEKQNYTVTLGSSEDSSFLSGDWNRREQLENDPQKTARWSGRASRLVLPKVPGKAYRLTVHLIGNPWSAADAEQSGIWLDDQQKTTFRTLDTNTFSVDIPASDAPTTTLELRTPGWIPKATDPQSLDDRTLGVFVTHIEMCAQ